MLGAWAHILGAGAPGAARIVVPGAEAPGAGARAPEAAPNMRFLAFSSRFQSFFRVETPKNLK